MYGMRGDRPGAAVSEPSPEVLRERHKELQAALTQESAWRSEPVADIGEWAGGRVKDPGDDFACRYMFAFWRLLPKASRPQPPPPGRPAAPGQ